MHRRAEIWTRVRLVVVAMLSLAVRLWCLDHSYRAGRVLASCPLQHAPAPQRGSNKMPENFPEGSFQEPVYKVSTQTHDYDSECRNPRCPILWILWTLIRGTTIPSPKREPPPRHERRFDELVQVLRIAAGPQQYLPRGSNVVPFWL